MSSESQAYGMAHVSTIFGVSLATSLIEKGVLTFEEAIEIVDMTQQGLENNPGALDDEAVDGAVQAYELLRLALGAGAERALDAGEGWKVSRDAPDGAPPAEDVQNSRSYGIAHANSCLWLTLVVALRDSDVLPEDLIRQVFGLAKAVMDDGAFDEGSAAARGAQETIETLQDVLFPE